MVTPTEDPHPHEPPLATWTGEAPSAAPEEHGVRPRVAPVHRGAPLPVAAAVAALWAGVLGLAPLVGLSLAVAIGTQAEPLNVTRISVWGWLLGHGVPVVTPTDRITLVPLGVTAWICWRLSRAGVHVGRATGALRSQSTWLVVRAGLAVAVGYGLIGAGAATLARTAQVSTSAWRTGTTFAVLAGVCATAGALGHARAGRRLAARLPRVLIDGLRAGLAAICFLLAAGAAAAGLSLALAGRAASDVLGSLNAGVAGQIGITALCLAFLPNLAVWGAAYLLGPGFAVGTGTVVSPGDVLLGPVPALPVLAGLPSGPLSGLGPALLGVPLIAGLAAGILLARRRKRVGGWGGLFVAAALAGPVSGIVLHVGTIASRGGLGSGRLSELGPLDWHVSLFATGVIAAGAMFGAAAARTLSPPATSRSPVVAR
jgi:hypothetical protein